MRKFITFSIFILSVFIVCGSTVSDSTKVFFGLNRAVINPAHDNNAESMKKIVDGILAAAASGTLDSIAVYGYASPDGSLISNYNLSEKRCIAFADYISSHTGIPLATIHTHPEGASWDALRSLVIENHLTPQRKAVLEILDKYLPAASYDPVASAKCINSLKSFDNGHTYRWMAANLFPELRFSLGVYVYNTADYKAFSPKMKEADLITPLNLHVSTLDTIVLPDYIEPDFTRSYSPFHRLAIKTNLLYYGALLPNIELEWRIDKRWSVALEYDMAWWGNYSKGKSYRLAMLSPEVKRWIRPRAPWHGFYVGLFAGGGLYDLENGEKGYRGEGLMCGLSAGFMWPVSRCLSFEAAIGVGYLYTRYKEYKYMDGCHVYQLTKDLNYFGPLKVKFSLVWRLWDKNKKQYNALREETRQ